MSGSTAGIAGVAGIFSFLSRGGPQPVFVEEGWGWDIPALPAIPAGSWRESARSQTAGACCLPGADNVKGPHNCARKFGVI